MNDVEIRVDEPGRTTLRLVVDAPLVIGRDCEGLVITDGQASRRHVQITPVRGGLEVIDLQSTNGTTFDGRPITSVAVIAPGQCFTIGSTVVACVAARPMGERPPIGRATVVATEDLRRTSIDDVLARAASGGSELLHGEHHLGTITIVFSDIEGSTELVTSNGDVSWFEVLSHHNAVLRRAAARHAGVESLNQGDGFMFTFPSARRAVEAMVAAQRELASPPVQERIGALRVRVGMHTGEVLVDDRGELFGQHIHLAARVGAAARGGEILVSSLTRALLATRGDLRFGSPRTVELKGISEPQTVHPILWDASDAS